MFDVGFGELLVCAIVALLVLGPERLPGAVRTVGRWVGRARHTVNHFTEQIDREIRAEELKRRIEEEMKKAGVHDLPRQLENAGRDATKEVDDVARQVKEALHAPLPLPEPLVGADHLRAPENSIAPPPAAAVTTPPPSPADTAVTEPVLAGATPATQAELPLDAPPKTPGPAAT